MKPSSLRHPIVRRALGQLADKRIGWSLPSVLVGHRFNSHVSFEEIIPLRGQISVPPNHHIRLAFRQERLATTIVALAAIGEVDTAKLRNFALHTDRATYRPRKSMSRRQTAQMAAQDF
jgi:hypothetical protein